MVEYFFTESFDWIDLNGQKIIKKELANDATLDIYGQTVYDITLENGVNLIAYPDEIISKNKKS